jgi:hypothetical protein
MRVGTYLVIVAFLAVTASSAWAIPAFPGAEGAAAMASGGRGCEVYHVTTLSPTGPGSFLDAISQDNRTIVFDVGGTIKLPADYTDSSEWYVTGNNVTIAGQTAPGQGIFIEQGVLMFGHSRTASGVPDCNNMIVRNLHVRAKEDYFGRAINCMYINGKNVIFDHISCEFGSDKILSEYHVGYDNTVQYCIVAEPLNYTGIAFASFVASDHTGAVMSYHHNLYASMVSCAPYLGNEANASNVVDWRNNVIYNWQGPCGTSSPGPHRGSANFINNYYIAGQDTASGCETEAFRGGSTLMTVWQSGNLIDGDVDGTFDGTDTGWGMFTGTYTKAAAELATGAEVYTQSAEDARQQVLNYVGSNWWNRDPSVDGRIVNYVASAGLQGTIINWSTQGGGNTVYQKYTRPADWDTDQDGMPGYWELERGLDPNVDDHNGDYDADGYTNIEEYLNELAAFPAPKPIVWTGGTAGRFELTTNWDLWQPSQYDQAEINSGKATVGYIGQLAGTVIVANAASSSGELAVTAGSLALANRLILGNASGARGTATLTGGSLTAGGAIVLASASSSTGVLKVSKDAYVQVGGLTINTGGGRSSKLGVEIASDAHSLIHTTAASSLGGIMDVQVLDGWRPKEGDTFVVISSTDPNAVYYTGNFSSFTSNITTGLPGSSAFGGGGGGANYELVFLGYTSGDANGDHFVDGGDLALLGGSWGQGGQSWASADFTGEGTVDGGDLSLLGGNWSWSLPGGAPGVPVPEPASLALLAFGSAALIRRRNSSTQQEITTSAA